MSAGRRERQQRPEQAEAATPRGSTQGSSPRSLHRREHGAPAHPGFLSRLSTAVADPRRSGLTCRSEASAPPTPPREVESE